MGKRLHLLLKAKGLSNSYPVYLISQSVTSFTYGFTCTNGVEYQVSFDPIKLSNIEHNQSDRIYAIAFAPKTESIGESKHDKRIKDTIAASITGFIDQEHVAVAFICDSNDNKEKCRYKLFEKWSRECLDAKTYGYAPRSIEYQNNMEVFGGIIWKMADEEIANYLTLVDEEFKNK